MSKPKKNINIDEQTIKVANLLKELFSEIEKLLHIKINKYAQKETPRLTPPQQVR